MGFNLRIAILVIPLCVEYSYNKGFELGWIEYHFHKILILVELLIIDLYV